MKLFFPCLECAKETEKPSPSFVFLDIRNDGLYNFTCTKGHKTVIALQEQKFEILFEIGAQAILDGYYREAVSSFSASLERFYEFYVKVICSSRDINEEQIHNAWKEISRQSERQLGAFIYVYLIETGQTPKILSPSEREFRNKVIHKGKIPDKKEAIEYGQKVLDLIIPVLNDLKQSHEEQMHKMVSQHLKRIVSNAPKGIEINTVSYCNTIVNISAESSGLKRLKNELDRIAFERKLFVDIEKS
jgi:hypothetical protein